MSNFNRLVETVTYVERALSKTKPETTVVSVEEKKTKAIIFKSLQREEFVEVTKSLKIEKEIPKSSKTLQFSPFPDEVQLVAPKAE